jgi:hypothetical protein
MASHKQRVSEVKIELDEYRFSDGQPLKEIKKEPIELQEETAIEVSQEERLLVRCLANFQSDETSEICNKKCICSSAFQVQSKKVHDEKKRIKDTQCSMELHSMQQSQNHMATNHKFANESMLNSNRPFCCSKDDCRKSFRTKIGVKHHEKTHDETIQVKCPKCLKLLSSKKYLRNHIAEIHEKKSRFECDLCPKVYYSKSSMVVHLRRHLMAKLKTPEIVTKPTEMTSLHCPICFKLLSSKQYQQMHIKVIHEKKVKFSCDLCPHQSYFKFDLRKHMSSHIFCNDSIYNSNRPFQCNFKNCGKFYKTQYDLKHHQKRHTSK